MSDRTGGATLRLYQGRFRLDMRENETILRGLPSTGTAAQAVVGSASLGGFKIHVDVALGAVGSCG